MLFPIFLSHSICEKTARVSLFYFLNNNNKKIPFHKKKALFVRQKVKNKTKKHVTIGYIFLPMHL